MIICTLYISSFIQHINVCLMCMYLNNALCNNETVGGLKMYKTSVNPS